MTIREAIMEGAALLRENGSESPFLDASLLASLALSADSNSLLSRYPELFPQDARGTYSGLLSRRSRGEPIAYISGRKEFRSLDFEVDPGVLIPRPETEHLVEAALAAAAGLLDARGDDGRQAGLSIHDCCAGSGCVAVALARELPALHPGVPFRVSMSDISARALETASRNARRILGRELPASLADAMEGLPPGAFDIVTANPPYLTDNEMETVLARGEGEPETALRGGIDGLDVYRDLAPRACGCLVPGGCLLVEIGAGQGGAILSLLEENGFRDAFVERDLSGLDRVAGGWKRG